MCCPLQSWKFIYVLSQDGNFIHCMKHTLNKIVDTRFPRDMLNTNAMQDIEGEMEYVWQFKNKTIRKWLQI